MGKLQLMPGCDEEQSLEHEILGVLNQIRTTASEVTFHPSLHGLGSTAPCSYHLCWQCLEGLRNPDSPRKGELSLYSAMFKQAFHSLADSIPNHGPRLYCIGADYGPCYAAEVPQGLPSASVFWMGPRIQSVRMELLRSLQLVMFTGLECQDWPSACEARKGDDLL